MKFPQFVLFSFSIFILISKVICSEKNCALKLSGNNTSTATYAIFEKDNQEYIISAYHCIFGQESLYIQLSEIKSTSKVQLHSIVEPLFLCKPESDLVIFKCSRFGSSKLRECGYVPIQIKAEQIPQAGNYVSIIGNPKLGNIEPFNMLTGAYVCFYSKIGKFFDSFPPEVEKTDIMCMQSFYIGPGFSGGPICSSEPEYSLVGILNGAKQLDNHELFAFGIPSSTIVELLNNNNRIFDIMQSQKWPKQLIISDNLYSRQIEGLQHFEIRGIIRRERKTNSNFFIDDTLELFVGTPNNFSVKYNIAFSKPSKIYAVIEEPWLSKKYTSEHDVEVKENDIVDLNFTITPKKIRNLSRTEKLHIKIFTTTKECIVHDIIVKLVYKKYLNKLSIGGSFSHLNQSSKSVFRQYYRWTDIVGIYNRKICECGFFGELMFRLSNEIRKYELFSYIADNHEKHYLLNICLGYSKIIPFSKLPMESYLIIGTGYNIKQKNFNHDNSFFDNFYPMMGFGFVFYKLNRLNFDLRFITQYATLNKYNFSFFSNATYSSSRYFTCGVQGSLCLEF